MADEEPFEGPAQANDPRWPAHQRAWLMTWERRERWLIGFRKHLVRTHHTNRFDACDCGPKRIPDFVTFFDPSGWVR